MGLFTRKKIISVASVVYNMAGDEFKRPNYLKTTVISAVIDNSPSIAQAITGSYMKGPAMTFRAFRRWADRTDYNDVIGLVTGSISTGDSVDADAVKDELPPSTGTIILQNIELGPADYTYWADQYVLENFPELINSEYLTDFNEETDEIVITWEDTTTTTFSPVNYEKGYPYMYVVYSESFGEIPQPIVTGPVIDLFPSTAFPDTTGWDVISFTDDLAGTTHGVYERVTFMGPVPGEDATYSLKETMYQDETPTTKTYQTDTQEIWHSASSAMQIFIYKYGSGNAILDAMFAPSEGMDQFYPVIPIRLDNKFISEDYLPDVYELAKKGYKKATTGKFDDLIDSLKENEDLEDIDYAYTVFGVCLNVLEQSSRKYIYEFFKHILASYAPIGTPEYVAWQAQWTSAKESWDDWTTWRTAQENPLDPLYGTTEPTKLAYPTMPANSLRVSTAGNPTINYDMTISWNSITETVGTGLLKPDAKIDQLWFTKGDQTSYDETIWASDTDGIFVPIEGGSSTVDEIFLNWQVTMTTWRRLRIVGLKHKNLIYGGKSVDISAFEALDDPEESGFIIPLHDGVFRAMGMKDGTQMCTANCFLVFNCYEVRKQKWYETTLFQIILVIIAIIIIVVTWGGATPYVAQALGAYFAAIGMTTLMAAILAATIYVLAAMLVARLITASAVKLLGDKWGGVVGVILSVVTMQIANGVASGASLASSFANMISAQNIMMLMSAVGDGYAAFIQASTMDLLAENAKVLAEYSADYKAILEAWETNLGGVDGVIDPTAVSNSIRASIEPLESFLQRTLMTGMDVADISMSMLTNFVDMTVNTDLPT
jgi:hypothetical protein